MRRFQGFLTPAPSLASSGQRLSALQSVLLCPIGIFSEPSTERVGCPSHETRRAGAAGTAHSPIAGDELVFISASLISMTAI
jgi:hypothetical protein